MSMGIDENEIILVPISSADDFKNGWNNMGTIQDSDGNEISVDIDHIIIETHGNPIQIGDNVNWEIGLDDIDKLDAKDVKGNVVLLGCNNGHLDYKNNNVASRFAKKVNGALVIASDGTVNPKIRSQLAKGADKTIINTPNGYYKSLNDYNFQKELSGVGDRNNGGWVVYRYTGSAVTTRVADSGSKVLTISGACRLIY